MIQRSHSSLYRLFFCAAIFSMTTVFVLGQTKSAQSQKDAVPEKSTHAQPADVSGNWRVSWEARLGTEPATLHLQQDGRKLTGTFKDLHGLSSLSGTVDENRISFDVQFQGPHPFTTRFTGNADGGKIEGTSQAVNVVGEGGAYLGHAGEVVHPEHPWTAARVAGEPSRSSESKLDPPAKN